MLRWLFQWYAWWLNLQYGTAKPPTPPPEPPRSAPGRRPSLRVVVRNAAFVLALLPTVACAEPKKSNQLQDTRECYTSEQLMTVMRQVFQLPVMVGIVKLEDDFVHHYSFFASPISGNWTLFEVKQKGRACVVARGINWNVITPDAE